MATYKKHGNKPKKSATEKVAQKSTTAKFFTKLDYCATLFEDWVARNRKVLITLVGVVVVVILGYLAYDNFVLKPRQEEAVKEMGVPLKYFSQGLKTAPGPDRDTLFIRALHGAGGYGLLDIVDNYSGTDAANIAQYSSGMAFLKLGKYDEAIDHLEAFSGKDEFYPAVTKGALGDAFSEKGAPEKALTYYEQAANVRKNTYTTPRYLLKAAVTALQLDKKDKAQELLNRIKEKYPDSAEADKVSVYLGLAGSKS